MKKSSLLFGLLIMLASFGANAGIAALNLEGRVIKSTGLETGREGQSCSLTLQPTASKVAKFYFSIGENSDLYGIRESNTKRAFSDYVYVGPQTSGNHMVQLEEVIIDVKSEGQKAILIRRLLQRDPYNVFTHQQLSEIKCVLILKN